MTTFEGAMNTDINFQNIMDDKAAEPDKPPSVDVLKIRWTCENILEDVSRYNTWFMNGFKCFFKIEEDMLEAFQAFEDEEEPDDEEFVEKLCLDTDICTEDHHDEL